MIRPVSMLGESNTGGEGIPADLICAAWSNGDLDAVVRWYEAGPGDLNETVTGDRPVIRAPIEGYTLLSIVAKCRVDDVGRRPQVRLRPAERPGLERPLVLAMPLQYQQTLQTRLEQRLEF